MIPIWFPTAVCVTAGAILAYNGIEGWGWFLFVAVLIYTH